MVEIREGNVVWRFDDGWLASHYDDWAYYRNQLVVIEPTKGADIVALDAERSTLWIIEAKDYRRGRRDKSKPHLWESVPQKVRDTLAGLRGAAVHANDWEERELSEESLKATSIRVVLHMEQAPKKHKLFPHAYDPAALVQKLKAKLKAIDPHPLIESTTARAQTPWEVVWSPPSSVA